MVHMELKPNLRQPEVLMTMQARCLLQLRKRYQVKSQQVKLQPASRNERQVFLIGDYHK